MKLVRRIIASVIVSAVVGACAPNPIGTTNASPSPSASANIATNVILADPTVNGGNVTFKYAATGTIKKVTLFVYLKKDGIGSIDTTQSGGFDFVLGENLSKVYVPEEYVAIAKVFSTDGTSYQKTNTVSFTVPSGTASPSPTPTPTATATPATTTTSSNANVISVSSSAGSIGGTMVQSNFDGIFSVDSTGIRYSSKFGGKIYDLNSTSKNTCATGISFSSGANFTPLEKGRTYRLGIANDACVEQATLNVTMY